MQENVNGSYKGQMERRAKWRPEGATSNDFTKVLDGKKQKRRCYFLLRWRGPPSPPFPFLPAASTRHVHLHVETLFRGPGWGLAMPSRDALVFFLSWRKLGSQCSLHILTKFFPLPTICRSLHVMALSSAPSQSRSFFPLVSIDFSP